MASLPDRMILMTTRFRCIAFAIGANGRLLAREFLKHQVGEHGRPTPIDNDEAPAVDQLRFVAKFIERMVFHVTTAEGLCNEEQFKDLKGHDLCEFKAHPWRILAFEDGRFVFLTHPFLKPFGKKHTDPEEIKRAERIRAEHYEWMSENGITLD